MITFQPFKPWSLPIGSDSQPRNFHSKRWVAGRCPLPTRGIDGYRISPVKTARKYQFSENSFFLTYIMLYIHFIEMFIVSLQSRYTLYTVLSVNFRSCVVLIQWCWVFFRRLVSEIVHGSLEWFPARIDALFPRIESISSVDMPNKFATLFQSRKYLQIHA